MKHYGQETHQFVPHNLAGEGPRYGAPVELCWPGKRGNAPRDLLINLQSQFADFATAFHEVIDFVPIDEQLKSWRENDIKFIVRSFYFDNGYAANLLNT